MEDEIGDPRLETLLVNLRKWLKSNQLEEHVTLDYMYGGVVRIHDHVIEYEPSAFFYGLSKRRLSYRNVWAVWELGPPPSSMEAENDYCWGICHSMQAYVAHSVGFEGWCVLTTDLNTLARVLNSNNIDTDFLDMRIPRSSECLVECGGGV